MSAELNQITVVDKDARIFEAIGVVEMSDNRGALIKPEEVKKHIDTYMRRSGVLHENHSNRSIGKILDWWETVVVVTDDLINQAIEANPNNSEVKRILERYRGQELPAIGVRAQIHKDYEYDTGVWQKILNKEYAGISLGSRTKDFRYDPSHKATEKILTALWEFSVVPAGAVALSLMTGINNYAQSDDPELQEFLSDRCHACGHESKQGDSPMTSNTQGVQNETYEKEVEEQQGADKLLQVMIAQGIDETKAKAIIAEAYPADEDGSAPAVEPEESQQTDTPESDAQSGSSENTEEDDAKDHPSENTEMKKEQETKQADEAPEEAPAAADNDELVSRISALEERLAAVEESLSPDESEGEESVQEDEEDKPAEESADKKESSDEAEEKPSDEEESKQADTVKVQSEARGESESKQGSSGGIDAAAVGRGEQNVSFSQARGAFRK